MYVVYNTEEGYQVYKLSLNIPALNYTFGSSSTVQPASIYQLILIKI